MAKRHLTRQEEFDLLKIILDKFLWVGVATMGYGFYTLVAQKIVLWYSFTIMAAGALLLFLFAAMLTREYHFMKG